MVRPHVSCADNDVAAFGNNILVVQNGDFEVSGGTSASGPIFAGECRAQSCWWGICQVLARRAWSLSGSASVLTRTYCVLPGVVGLLNDQLLSAGKPSLGFMNPFLYSAAAKQASDNFQMFNVVHGGNNRCVRMAGTGVGEECVALPSCALRCWLFR